jgi:2-keto-4-pentenoate hydratase/2-oxohepta-3-ene-1,7-dioic acid hydratase in catechol pathway
LKIYRYLDGRQSRYAAGSAGSIRAASGSDLGQLRGDGAPLDPARLELLAPVEPGKIVAVGRNYADHAKELGNEAPAEPIIFLKAPSAVLAPGAPIVRPAASQRVDFEGELALVIGKRARNVPAARWRDYVFGFTCANDVTARDLQKKDVQFTRGKSFDTFCPLGPCIETELDPSDLRLTTRVNGETRQDSSTSKMIFSCATVVEFISGIMTLEPGDVILTGTPSGVGPLQTGDTVEVEIAGIGVLKNPVR